MDKWVYNFGNGHAEGRAEMKELLGGKGANLAEMSAQGLPVPPGYTITTEVCTAFYANGREYPSSLKDQVNQAMQNMESTLGSKFGDSENPLLVSVRSGGQVSMPGMMDTVLNLGLNDETVKGLAEQSQNPRFAYDSYRRFIQMYADIVLGVKHSHFEDLLEAKKYAVGVVEDTDLGAEDLKVLVEDYKLKVLKETGKEFPQDVQEQFWGAVSAVFLSWMNSRAVTYRHLYNISDDLGTAVTVQSMVFGNMGDDCATGVAFTRDPSTGEKCFYGEYLINAQGEDVVAGIRTPHPITVRAKAKTGSGLPAMEETMPDLYKELVSLYQKLEKHYRDMQDIEFTIQNKKLWILQTRSGKRTAFAAIKIAVDMVKEGLIDQKEAVLRIDPVSLDQLLHPTLDPNANKQILAKGLPASPGAASGKVVFDADEAEKRARMKEKVLLVRVETSPEDLHGMSAAQGILTSRGGMTSHAAVVARGMGKACVAGAGDIRVNYGRKSFNVNGTTVQEGDVITINGSTGEVILGEVATIDAQLSEDFSTLMGWADEIRTMKVRANAETPQDCKVARDFGAEGIGLCRTEHMFFDPERILSVREMILANSGEGREKALAKILPMQKGDFKQLFQIMAGLPVTIRLLDPPLHEFLPHGEEEMQVVANVAGISLEELKHRARGLEETNPMLGHRGCRLGISYPEISSMQARAIFEAAAEVTLENKIEVEPEIMIPLVLGGEELEKIKKLIDDEAKIAHKKFGVQLKYMVGTMIELPRAALLAGEIAKNAEFFSFGTNDLTQTTWGLSRHDSGSFLDAYLEADVISYDPFVSLDESGVGELIEIAARRGKAQRADIKLGICGEHGGDPRSINFFHNTGLDYISCSPYRVPIARLAAAHAVLNNETKVNFVDLSDKRESASFSYSN